MRPTVLLISLNGGALLMLGAALFMPLPMPKPAELTSAPATASAPPPLRQKLPSWPEVAPVQRSLFRPVATTVAPPALPLLPAPAIPQPAAEPTLVLRGVLSDGSRWMALIEIEGEPERRLVGRGDAVGKWIVSSVAARSLTLNRRGEQRELPLDPPP